VFARMFCVCGNPDLGRMWRQEEISGARTDSALSLAEQPRASNVRLVGGSNSTCRVTGKKPWRLLGLMTRPECPQRTNLHLGCEGSADTSAG